MGRGRRASKPYQSGPFESLLLDFAVFAGLPFLECVSICAMTALSFWIDAKLPMCIWCSGMGRDATVFPTGR